MGTLMGSAAILDVSKYQNLSGPINWNAVKADGFQAAVVKCTDGTSGVDPYWLQNHDAARGAGLLVAPYHFSEDGNSVAEAVHFASVWSAGWDFRPWLDEERPSANAAYISAFRASWRAVTGYQLFGVYGMESMLAAQLNPAGWVDSNTGIWAARYAASLGWTHPQLLIWQFSSSANVPGVLGHVDTDELMNGWTPAADQQHGAPAINTEDEMGFNQPVFGDGDGTEQSVQIPAAGMKFINFSTGFGNQLTVKQALCFGDTPSEPGQVSALAPVHAAGSDWVIDNDRPGPVPLPAGCRNVSVLYTCNGNATIWTSLQ